MRKSGVFVPESVEEVRKRSTQLSVNPYFFFSSFFFFVFSFQGRAADGKLSFSIYFVSLFFASGGQATTTSIPQRDWEAAPGPRF